MLNKTTHCVSFNPRYLCRADKQRGGRKALCKEYSYECTKAITESDKLYYCTSCKEWNDGKRNWRKVKDVGWDHFCYQFGLIHHWRSAYKADPRTLMELIVELQEKIENHSHRYDCDR